MIIEHLTFFEENLEKINGGKYVIPFEENIMDKLDSFGKVFPKAYQEFMYLTIGNPHIHDSGINDDIDYALERQQYTKELLAENGFKFTEDIWVIADLDGGEQFDFFIFNDPTAEDPENPPVYFFDANYFDDEVNASKKNISRSFESFSDYVEGNASVRMEEKGFL